MVLFRHCFKLPVRNCNAFSFNSSLICYRRPGAEQQRRRDDCGSHDVGTPSPHSGPDPGQANPRA